MTEKKLIESCLKGDSKSQKELFDLFAGKMFTLCKRYARTSQESEDMLQEAFVKVFNSLDKFSFKGSFEGWIRRIVVNTCLRYLEKEKISFDDIALVEYSSSNVIQSSAIDHLAEEELLRLIASLPDGYKMVFNLYVIEGYSHKEIAEMLGFGESTSRSQLVKARKLLKELLIQHNEIFYEKGEVG
ncbi:MAG: RNA polymerase sigma factor [Saprospiraceae bacterium]|nr:RNA polymerase sigma factor [Saprospiraceae bacterium]